LPLEQHHKNEKNSLTVPSIFYLMEFRQKINFKNKLLYNEVILEGFNHQTETRGGGVKVAKILYFVFSL
jgi:hypothetical protein